MAQRRLSVHLLAALAILPLLVWWLGWYPGFASSDTIDQWTQGLSGDYINAHPPIHTLYLEAISLGNSRPGLVSLFQVLALTALLVMAARRLIEAGVPGWIAAGAAWLLGISPAVAPTTLTLWKDVVFGLFVLWAWIELLALATDEGRWDRLWPGLRLGIALGGIWVFRGNGPITVVILLALLAWPYRHRLRRLLLAISATAVIAVFVSWPLAVLLELRGPGIDPAQVFLPDIAAAYTSEPRTFPEDDIEMMARLAPIHVWTERYDCYDSTPLLFDPAFDHDPLRQDRWSYRALVLRVFLRDPDSVVGHRACAANFLFFPPQPSDSYFHRPPYEIPANEVGLSRQPISVRAFAVTDRVWRWSEQRLWLTWRPAIVILPALAVIALLATKPATRRLLVPSGLLLAHLGNVALTSPAQEFRYAYPLYLIAVLTLTLSAPALRALRADGPDSALPASAESLR